MSSESQPVLYHLHIPKTAGTTLREFIEDHIGRDFSSPSLLDGPGLLRLPISQFQAIRFFSGHLEFGYYLPKLLNRPVKIVTFLREPQALLLSMYKQVMQEVNDPLHAHVKANCPDIESFFFDPYVSTQLYNPQVTFLSIAERRIRPDLIDRIRTADPDELPGIIAYANATQDVLSPSASLRRAKRRLRQCSVLGFVERMEQSLERICTRFGWDASEKVTSLNVSSVTVPRALSPRLRQRLAALTRLDQQLYEHHLRRFDNQPRSQRFYSFGFKHFFRSNQSLISAA